MMIMTKSHKKRHAVATATSYSIFDGLFISSAHIAKPTCAQSFDPQSLQNGTPSTISTIISLFKILSCNTTFLPSVKSFIIIGIARECLSSTLSQRAKAVMPSSTSLFLTIVGITALEPFFLLIPDIRAPLTSFGSALCHLLNMDEDILVDMMI